jgi:serine/threonine protein kinase
MHMPNAHAASCTCHTCRMHTPHGTCHMHKPQGFTRGLEALHSKGIFHRDLKLENILLSRERPHHTTQRPHHTTQQPHHTTQQPHHTTQQPHHTTQQPHHTTQQPHHTARPAPLTPPCCVSPSHAALLDPLLDPTPPCWIPCWIPRRHAGSLAGSHAASLDPSLPRWITRRLAACAAGLPTVGGFGKEDVKIADLGYALCPENRHENTSDMPSTFPYTPPELVELRAERFNLTQQLLNKCIEYVTSVSMTTTSPTSATSATSGTSTGPGAGLTTAAESLRTLAKKHAADKTSDERDRLRDNQAIDEARKLFGRLPDVALVGRSPIPGCPPGCPPGCLPGCLPGCPPGCLPGCLPDFPLEFQVSSG